jgi:hypothetical protein
MVGPPRPPGGLFCCRLIETARLIWVPACLMTWLVLSCLSCSVPYQHLKGELVGRYLWAGSCETHANSFALRACSPGAVPAGAQSNRSPQA